MLKIFICPYDTPFNYQNSRNDIYRNKLLENFYLAEDFMWLSVKSHIADFKIHRMGFYTGWAAVQNNEMKTLYFYALLFYHTELVALQAFEKSIKAWISPLNHKIIVIPGAFS
jgi:hypothetical protein